MWMKGLPGRCGCWIGLTADDAVALACLRDDGLYGCWIGLTADDAVALACLRDNSLRTPRQRNNTRQRHQRKPTAKQEGQRDPAEEIQLKHSNPTTPKMALRGTQRHRQMEHEITGQQGGPPVKGNLRTSIYLKNGNEKTCSDKVKQTKQKEQNNT